MKKITLGKFKGRKVQLDVKTLLKTRMLVQAGSGGGKSWLLRLLAEQLFGKVQVFVIDREGEFSSLREKYGYVLAGDGGDTPTDVRSARLLAEKLLELNASAVFDLYESFRTKPRDRRAWVRGFLEGVMDAPKKFWRPLVLMVDEAHLFAPQESPKAANMVDREIISGCKDAMMALATAGRKRGYCAIFATQRLAKLDKDCSAELLNRCVGQTIEDVDVDRASDLMSVSRNEKAAFKKSIKNLDPGNFYCFGRAISRDRILVRVGKVNTTHPESGSWKHSAGPPPAPAKVKALLPKLSDLPQEADKKAKTEKELRDEIAALKKRMAKASKDSPKPAAPVKATPIAQIHKLPVITASEAKRIRKIIVKLEALAAKLGRVSEIEREVRSVYDELGGKLSDAEQAAQQLRQQMKREETPLTRSPVVRQSAPRRVKPRPRPAGSHNGVYLLKGERKILEVLAKFHPGARTRSQLGALSGYAPSGGTFGTYFGKLKREGLLEENGDSMRITDDGLLCFGDGLPEGPQTSEELLEMWREKLLKGERVMLDVLVEAHPKWMSREELGEASGYAASGGTFGTYLGTLRRNALLTIEGDEIKASDTLFEME